MNYLFIGAHPDDIEISAMGYLIKLLNKGHNIFMLVISLPSDENERIIRLEEQNKVYEYLSKNYSNFNYDTYRYTDGKLLNELLSIKNIIENYIKNNNCEVVITHFGKDTHLDHETVSKAVDIAARKISIINFESPNVFDFIPNFFVPLTKEELETKIKLMKLHNSQNIKNENFYLKKIEANAIFRGQSVYEEYAEAFYIKRYKENNL